MFTGRASLLSECRKVQWRALPPLDVGEGPHVLPCLAPSSESHHTRMTTLAELTLASRAFTSLRKQAHGSQFPPRQFGQYKRALYEVLSGYHPRADTASFYFHPIIEVTLFIHIALL